MRGARGRQVRYLKECDEVAVGEFERRKCHFVEIDEEDRARHVRQRNEPRPVQRSVNIQ